MPRRWLLVLIAIASAWAPAFADGPQPPCGGSIFPQIPKVGEAPAVKVWPRDAAWTPPVCTGWGDAGYGTLIVLAGRFPMAGGEAALIERIGAISKLQGVRYWSTTRGAWETLITSAG